MATTKKKTTQTQQQVSVRNIHPPMKRDDYAFELLRAMQCNVKVWRMSPKDQVNRAFLIADEFLTQRVERPQRPEGKP